MAISDRINEMYTHVGDVYDTITNVDLPTNKNIQNIPSTMRSSYLEIMNNGIDKIWNNWEKVEGTGETITLNSTEEAPMKINLKGNTSQETTTGKNKYNATRSSATTNAVTYSGDTSRIYINGTPNNTGRIFFNKTYLEAGTYTLSGTLSKGSFTNGGNNRTYLYLYKGTESQASWDFDVRILLTATIGNVASATFTISEGSYYYLAWYLDTSYTWTNAEIKYQVETGNSFTSFEPYTNGASPNPDYPQDIHVVSGDNEINVAGKNLISTNINDLEQGTISGSNGTNSSANNRVRNNKFFVFDYDNIQPNYVWQIPSGYKNALRVYDKDKNFVGTIENSGFINYLPQNYVGLGIKYVKLVYAKTDDSNITPNDIANLEFMISKGNDKTYEPYQSASYPINLGVENLLQNNLTSGTNNGITYVVNEDKSVTLNGTATAITWLILNSSVTLEAGTYTMTSGYSGNDVRVYSTGLGVYTLDGQRTVTKTSSVSGDVAINIPSGTICNNLTIKPMIEKGTKANSYTPYGTTPIELCKIGDYQDSIVKDNGKWFLHKEIGKVMFDGSENWSINTSYTYNVFYRTLDNYARISNAQTTYCEYYKGIENTAGIVDFGNNYNNSIGVRTANDNIKDIYISNNSITSASDFKIWLSTHNTIVYYVLATPTYTEITDSTLLSQLEAVKKSYTTQTNISQENNDKPFILDVTALKQLTQ